MNDATSKAALVAGNDVSINVGLKFDCGNSIERLEKTAVVLKMIREELEKMSKLPLGGINIVIVGDIANVTVFPSK